MENIKANENALSDIDVSVVDTQLQDSSEQSVQNIPKIVTVVSCAPQPPVATCQLGVGSVVFQSHDQNPKLDSSIPSSAQPATSIIPSDMPITMTIINNSDQSIAKQEPAVMTESVGMDAEVVVLQVAPEEDDDDNVPTADDENVSPNVAQKRRLPKKDLEVTKSAKRYASSEMKFDQFKVNWSKVSDSIIESLERLQDYRNKNPGKNIPKNLQFSNPDLKALTQVIVDQLRRIDTEIPNCVMESVAQQVYKKYPGLQFIDDDGCANPRSFVKLKNRLISRNSYKNRFKKPNTPTASTAEVRRNKNVKAGTLKEYWTTSSAICAKDIMAKLERDEPKILSEELLSVSQPYVRFRLSENKLLKEIIAGFPVARRRQLISFHFEKATGVPMDSFEKRFVAKRLKIVDFLRSRPKNTLNDAPSDYDVIASLCSLLGEKVDALIEQKEMGTKASEITTECAGPVLVAVDLENGNQVYYVFTEQVRLTEGSNDVIRAIADLLAVHYIHNFMYMKSISKFMELIQAYFYKIVPQQGSKSKATKKNNQQRVVQSLIEAISNHEPTTAESVAE